MTLAETLTTGLADTLRLLDAIQCELVAADATDRGRWESLTATADELCELAERYRAAILRRYGVAL